MANNIQVEATPRKSSVTKKFALHIPSSRLAYVSFLEQCNFKSLALLCFYLHSLANTIQTLHCFVM